MKKKEIRARLEEVRAIHEQVVELADVMEEFVTRLCYDLQIHHDSKSQRWQDGEVGQAVGILIDELGELEVIDIPRIPEFEV